FRADAQRAARAPLRRNAEAAPFGTCRRYGQQPALAWPVAWPAAAARRDSRAAAWTEIHRLRARRHRSARARGQGRVAGVPVRGAAVARSARHVEGGEGTR